MTARTFPVEAGHIMLFARAIGDGNPVCRNPEQARTSEVGAGCSPTMGTTAV
ncbi:MAG: FAS1-like dehydratase domain-containing protein [Acidimicrobiales bacterium]